MENRKILFERPSEADRIDPTLSPDQLLERKAELSGGLSQIAEVVDTIKRQLESPRLSDDDPEWSSRASAALKHYKRKAVDYERGIVNLTLAIRELERETEARRFVRAAKSVLPPELYATVWGEVHADA